MGIINSLLIRYTENSDIKTLKRLLKVNHIFNGFKSFFLFNNRNDEGLDNSLGHALKKCNYEAAKLFIDYGADVNSKNEGCYGMTPLARVVFNYETLNDPNVFTSNEKHFSMLGKLIRCNAEPQNVQERKRLKDILNESGFKKEAELLKSYRDAYLESEVIDVLKNLDRTLEQCDSSSSLREEASTCPLPPRLTKVKGNDTICNMGNINSRGMKAPPIPTRAPGTKLSSQVHNGCSTAFNRDSSSSEEDSGYLSISEESLYATIDSSEQKKLVVLQQNKESKEVSEPIYAKVDFAAKRDSREKKVKRKEHCRKNYHLPDKLTKHTVATIYLKEGIVQERIGKYELAIKEKQNSNVEKQISTQRIKLRTGFNVEQVKQKCENRDSGYGSGYESDTKMERLRIKHDLPKIPHSKVSSVRVESGIINGYRYRTTDVAF